MDTKKLLGASTFTAMALCGLLAARQACAQNGSASTESPNAAQDQTGQSTQVANSAQPDELQEVVVTAERRTTDEMTTPVSIAVTTGAQLMTDQVVTLADLQNSIPNLQVNTQGLYDSINIRGIGNSNINPSIAPGVVVFHDGLPATETLFITTPFFDIRDVETLRGPQGTLVSAASTGGSIDVNSQDPNLMGVNGYVEGQLGNYSDVKLDGAVNLPFNDVFALRLAYNVERENSFYTDIGAQSLQGTATALADPGQVDNNNFRIGALWKPTDSFNALLKVEADYANPGGSAAEPNPGTFQSIPGELCPNPNEGFGPVCHSIYYQYGTHQPYVLNYAVTNLYDREHAIRSGLDLHYTLPNGIVFRSLTGYQTMSLQASEADTASSATEAPLDISALPTDRYWSEDLTVQSPNTGALTWIVGAAAFYRWTPVYGLFESYPAFPSPGPLETVTVGASPPNVANIGTTARNQGLFGNVDWSITRALQVSLGLRSNRDENFSRGDTVVSIGGSTVAVVPPSPDYSDSTTTGKVGLNWTPAQGQFFYLFGARGYKPGGTQTGPQFQMEHVNDYELGWKGQLLENHLQVELGGYYMNYQHMQFQGFSTASGAAAVANLSGATTIDGIELTTRGRFGGFGTSLGISYLHSKLGAAPAQVESYALPASASNLPQCPPGVTTGCFNYVPYEVSVSGEENSFSPPLTVNASVDYGFALGGNVLQPRVTFTHVDSQWAGLFQTNDYLLMGARNLWNLDLSYQSTNWTAMLYCDNCSNDTYVSGMGYIHGGGGLGQDVFYGAPRQFGVLLNRTF